MGQDGAGDGRVQPGPAAGDDADRLEQRPRLGVLEEEAVGAGAQGGQDEVVVVEGGQDQDS